MVGARVGSGAAPLLFTSLQTSDGASGALFQAQVLVCRALSNILLLPWPNLPENEQQWPVRSINHASLISALSRDYRNLKPNAVAPQRKMPLDDSKWPLGRASLRKGRAGIILPL